MSIMMSAYDSSEQLVLLPEDFPWLKQEAHPDDYKISPTPIEPEITYHHYHGRHNRLWLRLSWQLGPEKFAAMSFVLDIGAPKHFYLESKALQLLEDAGLTRVDDDLNVQYVHVFGRKCLVEETTQAHKSANIIGLEMLMRLGLQLHDGVPHISFERPLSYLAADSV